VFSSYTVHWVFVAKYRRRVFDAGAIDVLRGILADVCSDAQARLVEMDGEDDHVHLLVEYPPKVAVACCRRRASWSNTASDTLAESDFSVAKAPLAEESQEQIVDLECDFHAVPDRLPGPFHQCLCPSLLGLRQLSSPLAIQLEELQVSI
jgi:hypothetical protein